jgi:ADP-heptose:LPS heptosyltransferase
MKALVLQLCRMGDVVQTIPMLAALTDDGYEVHLLVRGSLCDLPIPGEAASLVYTFPEEDGESRNLDDALGRIGRIAKLLVDLRAQRYDLVVNLSHDAGSGWIGHFVGAAAIRGIVNGRDRTNEVRDPWMEYLLCLPSNRLVGAYNLVDVYASIAGVARPIEARVRPDEEARRRARSLLERSGLRENRIVGLVPGASDGRKRWSAKRFAEVATGLHDLGLGVVLLGAHGEAPLAARVKEHTSAPLVSLAGDTSLSVLSALLSELDLVITNDTGTMHLAAAVGTPTLTVTLGPAHVHESAPFGEGHLVIEPELHCHPCDFASYCADPVCHDLVSPEAVLELTCALLFGRDPDARTFGSCRVFRTAFDRRGLLVVHPLHRLPIQISDLMRLVYREPWEVSPGSSRTKLALTEVVEGIHDHWDCSGVDALVSNARSIEKAAGALEALLSEACEHLLLAFRGNVPGDDVAGTLSELGRNLDLAGRFEPSLRPLTAHALLQLRRAGSRSPELAGVSALRSLASAGNRVRLFQSLVSLLRTGLENAAPPPRMRSAQPSFSSL